MKCPLLKLPITDVRCLMKIREELKTWGSEEIALKANRHCPCKLRVDQEGEVGKVTAVMVDGKQIEDEEGIDINELNDQFPAEPSTRDVPKMIDEGIKQKDIAVAIGITPGRVSQIKAEVVKRKYTNATSFKKEEKPKIIVPKKSIKKPRPCANCGRAMLIQGAGLCGACRSIREIAIANDEDVDSALADAKKKFNPAGIEGLEPVVERKTVVVLHFTGDDELLYEKISQSAKQNRRLINQHILWILEEKL